MASTYDYEVSINGIEGEFEEEEEDEIEASEPLHHARRPMNAFLIFCKRQRAVVKERFPQLENRAVTKILGEWWANLEESEKSCYTDLAKQYREAFLKANPGFKWYKLPAPPLRPISNRLKLLTGLGSHQGSITPGKLADESQLGGLSSLLVPYNNMSVSPSLAVQSVPKPPKKRYLEENATSDDPSQVVDEAQEKLVTVETKAVSSNLDNGSMFDRIVEIEPFAKLRNYSVSAKENIAEVKTESVSNSISVRSNGSLQTSSAGNYLVISSNNNTLKNDSHPYSLDRNIPEIKCKEFLFSEGNKLPNNASLCSTPLNDSVDCTEVKWKTKFEKIKSRHSNYNNNNIDESSDSLKCSSYECSSNQDSVTNKLANGALAEAPKDCSSKDTIKKEEVFVNGDVNNLIQSFDKPNIVAQIAPLNSVEQILSTEASSVNNKSDVFYHTNKLPDVKTANKLLNKSVPIMSNESDSNFMRRNKSVRACKGVRYQEFMSSNQLGRKRRRKINASNDIRYEGNEDEDTLNRHLVKFGSEEFKSIKDEEKYEKMEVESAIYNIHDDIDQNDSSLNEMSVNAAMNKSTQARRVKHIRPTKRRRSLTSAKSNSVESMSDDMDTDKKCNSTNFNLEEKIEALPALSLEEFQEKKRARNKKHFCLENNGGFESVSDLLVSDSLEGQSNSQAESDSSLASKFLTCQNSSSSFGLDRQETDSREFLPKLKETKGVNGFITNAESVHEVEVKSESNADLVADLLHSPSSSIQSNSSLSLNGTGSDQKSSASSVSSNVLIGSRKRKARRQKITHLEPGSKQKDTSVVEVDVLNDMGLATLAEVAALSRKESIM